MSDSRRVIKDNKTKPDLFEVPVDGYGMIGLEREGDAVWLKLYDDLGSVSIIDAWVLDSTEVCDLIVGLQSI